MWLAGEVLREVGAHRIGSKKQGKRLLGRVREQLTELLEQGALSARERAEAGDVLGELGDPRFDPEFFYLPCRYHGEPEALAGFVEIPAGPFVMGDGKDRQHLSIDYSYCIARYPVTVAPYGAFVEEGGNAPYGWDSQRLFFNRAVQDVSWNDAMAYCRWLDERLRRSGKTSVLKNRKYVLRLPTDAEWEKAAQAGDARGYPWGDAEWDEERANIGLSIGHPTPVGMYPKGATDNNAAALHDLGGNIWEWSLSLYQDYPYEPEDGRNDPNAAGGRVVRGGSWYFPRGFARCASRDWPPPDAWLDYQGFRVVLSLADSGF